MTRVETKPAGNQAKSDSAHQTVEELLEKYEPPKIQIPFQIVGDMMDEGTLPEGVTFTEEERKVIDHIRYCHTAEGGYTVEQCKDCGNKRIIFHSCKDRHCPLCQKIQKLLWEEKRNSEIIDAPYGHLVFTVPHQLNGIILANKKTCLPLIQKLAMDTVVELARDPRFLGATPGGYAVLHTWNQRMEPHFHVHLVVPYAGITDDRKVVYKEKGEFFIPYKAMSDLFRGKLMAAFDELRLHPEKLKLVGSDKQYINAWTWGSLKEKLFKDTEHWVAFGKEATPTTEAVTQYLAQYVSSICISEGRIVDVTSKKVTFKARSREDAAKKELVTIDIVTFVKRFCAHILPAGLHKVRYFGWMSNSKKKASLELFRQSQQGRTFHEFCYGSGSTRDIMLSEYGVDISVCPLCKGQMEVHTVNKGYFTFVPNLKPGKRKQAPPPKIKPRNNRRKKHEYRKPKSNPRGMRLIS